MITRIISLFASAALVFSQAPAKRPIKLDDMHRFHTVADPQVSPDGKWVAYTVSSVDTTADKSDTDIWMTSWDGAEHIRVTSSPEAETAPRWSPDGRYLAFTSSRPGKAKGNQIWLLDRRGGEARQFTDFKGRLSSYDWSPDSKRLLVSLADPDPNSPEESAKVRAAAARRPAPTRLLPSPSSSTATSSNRMFRATSINRHRRSTCTISPRRSWSCSSIRRWKRPRLRGRPMESAWRSSRAPVRMRTGTTRSTSSWWMPNPAPRRSNLPATTASQAARRAAKPEWSPDGKLLTYLQSSGAKQGAYNMNRLAVISADGGAPRILAEKLDRGIGAPHFTRDGAAVLALESDDRSEYPVRVPVSGGEVQRLARGPMAITSYEQGKDGRLAVIYANDSKTGEVYAFENNELRPLTHHNDALLAEFDLGATEEFSCKAKDGNEVHGLLVKPPDYVAGRKYPTLLRIHGGPNGQDAHAFNFERQLFAANGYVVLAVNYRGSSGRGEKYQVAISADWGSKEVLDLQAAVDYAIASGIADPNRLGVGGWSYGGILTDAIIAKDQRFKAATSGAGTAFPLALYGVDQYILQYDNEIGPPWKVGMDPWIKISYAFLHADQIKTPTLFLGGEKDFNVPLAGGEEMYQALRSLGVPTELVVYPGQFHGITRPSYQKDRMQRYLDWYAKYLK